MSVMTPQIILATCAVLWLLLCLLLYRVSRHAAWLAGTTVASCLFFLGVTVVASLQIARALFLLPLWLGVLVLAGLHLHAAQRAATYTGTILGACAQQRTTHTRLSAGENSGAYI